MHWMTVTLFSFLFQIAAPTIYVTVVDTNQQPVIAQQVWFRDESATLTGTCITDTAGTCEIEIEGIGVSAENTPLLIRGQLTIQAHGARPIIWPADENVAITIQLNVEGDVDIPTHADHAHDHVIDPTATAVPLPTATILPTIMALATESADAVSIQLAETTTPTMEAVSAERPLWPILLCSSLFILLWGGAVIFLYRRQAG